MSSAPIKRYVYILEHLVGWDKGSLPDIRYQQGAEVNPSQLWQASNVVRSRSYVARPWDKSAPRVVRYRVLCIITKANRTAREDLGTGSCFRTAERRFLDAGRTEKVADVPSLASERKMKDGTEESRAGKESCEH